MLHRLIDWLNRSFAHLLTGPVRELTYTREQVVVHPCVINNRAHIVYPRGLQSDAPGIYQQLCDYYQQLGYSLKEDQRHENQNRHRHERRRWVPILLFTTSMVMEGPALAETGNEIPHSHAHTQTALLIVPDPGTPVTAAVDRQRGTGTELLPPAGVAVDPAVSAHILEILTQHYKAAPADPEYVLGDFQEIADYYSRFPEILPILAALKDKKWELTYDERTWATVATGNVFRVDHAQVRFNTRAAAQLKLNNRCEANPVCIASPADALLHELLHTHSMLVQTREYLAQGGMSRVMYPYQHEYAVIEKERKLYASMTRADGIKRPQRIDHTGRLVLAQCATCIY